jgi:RHS repeat-associated protein
MYGYDSFGKLTASTAPANPFQYTGREFDQETGIYGYRHRYYDQNAGRFLSEDPVRSPIQTDRYKYVRNSPLNRVDSDGTFPSLSSAGQEGMSCLCGPVLRVERPTTTDQRRLLHPQLPKQERIHICKFLDLLRPRPPRAMARRGLDPSD